MLIKEEIESLGFVEQKYWGNKDKVFFQKDDYAISLNENTRLLKINNIKEQIFKGYVDNLDDFIKLLQQLDI